MLKLPIYIYETGYTLFSDLEPSVRQGYAPMYQKDIQIVKGVTNTIKFTVKNQDQKPIDVNGETFTFHLVDPETGAVYLDKNCTTLDDGSTTTTKGVVELALTESDVADKLNKFYKFSVSRTVNGTGKHPTYANTYYGIQGTLEIIDGVYAPFTPSAELPNTDFTRPLTNGYYLPGDQGVDYISSVVDADPEFKRTNPLHTVAYYTTEYTGELRVQATLDSDTGTGFWVDVETVTLTDATGVGYVNINGVYSQLRLVHNPDNANTGTFDKTLIRS